jgi:hypothetical protein
MTCIHSYHSSLADWDSSLRSFLCLAYTLITVRRRGTILYRNFCNKVYIHIYAHVYIHIYMYIYTSSDLYGSGII